ncbi:MAG: DUF4864 domain-containing protein [Pseudomonadota bacterium]
MSTTLTTRYGLARLLAAGLVALFFAALTPLVQTAQAQGTSASQNPAIQSVITQQLDAFRRDDGPGAFSHASPSIQMMFQSHQRFMAMVQRGYAPIYRSAEAKFLELDTVNGRLIQKVLIRGADGRVVVAAYDMIQVDGIWRINGCQILEAGAAA